MHSRLEHMKETLMCAVEMQLCDLSEVDTKELGEAIDMIKDLEEAIYYCTVTEAMKHSDSEMEFEMKNGNGEGQHYRDSRKYYPMYSDYESRDIWTSRMGERMPYMENGNGVSSNGEGWVHRDAKEGRSYNSRRMYMEAKEMRKDKASQLRELEKYMQELSQDIVEMITDSSPEEKQYLEKKISALASKVGQMK